MFETLTGLVQAGGALILSPLLRKWYMTWGTKQADGIMELAGDAFVPIFQTESTRSIDIDGTPAQIWPWLAQLGQGRGGLYSYDGVENLIGCNIHSADRILPEFQTISVGDIIRMGPKGYPCFRVAQVEPEQALVMISADNQTEVQSVYQHGKVKGYSIGTWQFFLQPVNSGRTRLVVRQRLDHSPDMKVIWRITEPLSFVMERKMLKGIKQRVERCK